MPFALYGTLLGDVHGDFNGPAASVCDYQEWNLDPEPLKVLLMANPQP